LVSFLSLSLILANHYTVSQRSLQHLTRCREPLFFFFMGMNVLTLYLA
jgi:type II secretory pathway component PulF